jgi:esterase/lipase
MRCASPARKVGDHGFLAAGGYDGEPDLAGLDVENRIGQIALREDGFTLEVFAPGFPGHELVKETVQVECGPLLCDSVHAGGNDLQLTMLDRMRGEGASW